MTVIAASLTRISDIGRKSYDLAPRPRVDWATGDYVACRVLAPTGLRTIELPDGTRVEALEGDVVLGALGSRFATLEATGDWKRAGADLKMEALTSAGLFGRATSVASNLPPLLPVVYIGHVERRGQKVTMSQFATQSEPLLSLTAPVILLIGSSMSSGKTTTACKIIRRLEAQSLRVAGTKLTGAGRYADILAMRNAGASAIFDFVDVGLPSTVCSRFVYERAVDRLLSSLERAAPHVVVAEVGASPIEPYNGEAAIEAIKDNIVLTILCASDPYAVLGVTTAFHIQPQLVAGVAASTEAGVALVERLTGLRAMNLLDAASDHDLDQLLDEAIRSYESTRPEERAHA